MNPRDLKFLKVRYHHEVVLESNDPEYPVIMRVPIPKHDEEAYTLIIEFLDDLITRIHSGQCNYKLLASQRHPDGTTTGTVIEGLKT